MRSGNDAFSLVELLVVIVVISVLAALMLPALEDALASARISSCLNNCKQTALAMTMYLDDSNDRVPPSYNYRSDGTVVTYRSSPSTRWYCTSPQKIPMRIGYLYPNYAADGHIFHCPDVVNTGSTGGANTALAYGGRSGTDYGWQKAEPGAPVTAWYANSNYSALAIIDAATSSFTNADFNLFPSYFSRFKSRSLLPRVEQNLRRPMMWDVGEADGSVRAHGWRACNVAYWDASAATLANVYETLIVPGYGLNAENGIDFVSK